MIDLIIDNQLNDSGSLRDCEGVSMKNFPLTRQPNNQLQLQLARRRL